MSQRGLNVLDYTRSSHPSSCLLAVGTYTEVMPHVQGSGLGIHLLEFDGATASFHERQVLRDALTNPSYLCAAPGLLYSVCEKGQDAALSVFAIASNGESLKQLGRYEAPGADPCHVSINPVAQQLYVSNYSSGELMCYALDSKGLPDGAPQVIARQGAGPRSDRQGKPHVHCAAPSPDGSRVYLCDLGTDTVACHHVQSDKLESEPRQSLQSLPGSGPRHLVLTADGAQALVVEELSNTVTLYALGESAQALCRVSTLPPGWQGANTASALRLHPNGQLLYAANRGHDSIAAYRLHRSAPWLEPLGFIPVGGRTPRDMVLTPDGAFLLVASQDDHFIRALQLDLQTGLPQEQAQGQPFRLHSPACLCPLP
jgi:6-phosphogluconolactonase